MQMIRSLFMKSLLRLAGTANAGKIARFYEEGKISIPPVRQSATRRPPGEWRFLRYELRAVAALTACSSFSENWDRLSLPASVLYAVRYALQSAGRIRSRLVCPRDCRQGG